MIRGTTRVHFDTENHCESECCWETTQTTLKSDSAVRRALSLIKHLWDMPLGTRPSGNPAGNHEVSRRGQSGRRSLPLAVSSGGIPRVRNRRPFSSAGRRRVERYYTADDPGPVGESRPRGAVLIAVGVRVGSIDALYNVHAAVSRYVI